MSANKKRSVIKVSDEKIDPRIEKSKTKYEDYKRELKEELRNLESEKTNGSGLKFRATRS